MKIYEVTWIDAYMSMKAFSQENVSNRKGLQELKTVGYLVHEDKLRIALAMQQNTNRDTNVRQIIWIPKSCIVSKVEVKKQTKGDKETK